MYKQLIYRTKQWILYDAEGVNTEFEEAYISFDAGLFFLLTLISEGKSKKLVLFNDQLSSSQYRQLNIIGKINSKK